MRSLLLAVLAAYVVSAIHAVLAFLNKRRALQRVSEWAMVTGFVLHTATLIADWAIDGHYPLYPARDAVVPGLDTCRQLWTGALPLSSPAAGRGHLATGLASRFSRGSHSS